MPSAHEHVSAKQFTPKKMPDKQLALFHTSETLKKEGIGLNPSEKQVHREGSSATIETEAQMRARKLKSAQGSGLDFSVMGTKAAERVAGTTGESAARGEAPIEGKGMVEPLVIRRVKSFGGVEADQLGDGHHREALSAAALPGEPGHIFPVKYDDKTRMQTITNKDPSGKRLPNGRLHPDDAHVMNPPKKPFRTANWDAPSGELAKFN